MPAADAPAGPWVAGVSSRAPPRRASRAPPATATGSGPSGSVRLAFDRVASAPVPGAGPDGADVRAGEVEADDRPRPGADADAFRGFAAAGSAASPEAAADVLISSLCPPTGASGRSVRGEAWAPVWLVRPLAGAGREPEGRAPGAAALGAAAPPLFAAFAPWKVAGTSNRVTIYASVGVGVAGVVARRAQAARGMATQSGRWRAS